MNGTDIYERLELQIIRTAILREIAVHIPQNYYARAQTSIEAKVADGKLGRMLSQNPILTPRQGSACDVLLFCGLYGGATEALARCEDLRRKLPSRQEDVEDARSKLIGWVDFGEYQLCKHLRLYLSQVSDEEARLLVPSLEALAGREREESASGSTANDRNNPLADGINKNLAELFDPLPRAGIEGLFNKDGLDWKKYFARAATNGLIEARQNSGSSIRYNPFNVGEWLVREGRYTQEQVDRKLGNNLPARSRDMKFLFTGKFDD